jgi:TolB-like protein/cytochrome c-type biogenesis protein CcmH/NrfG
MDKPFPADQGRGPSVFVCYSHKDAAVVYPELGWLGDQGVPLWYDEGISAGKVWRAEIAAAIDNADTVLYYVSAASVASEHCNREVHYALDKGYDVLPVYLEPIELSADLHLGLGRVQALHRHADADYQTRLLDALSAAGPRIVTSSEAPERTRRASVGIAIASAALLLTVWWWWPTTEMPGTLEHRPSLPLTSIAVLPFADMSPAGDQEHLSDGMAEELIVTLAQLEALRVVARTSAFAFKNAQADIRDIGVQLNAGSIVEGSIRTAGDTLRVTAQLVRTSDGYQLWSGRFDRALDDVFAIQDEIARAVAAALEVELGLTAQEPTKAVAFDAFERKKLGDYYLRKGDEANLNAALDQYRQAIEIAPEYAAAYVGAAQAHQLLWTSNYDPSADRRQKGIAAAQAALRLDPTSAAAISMQGMNAVFDFDWGEAQRHLQHALSLEPNNEDVIVGFAYLTSMLGDQDAAIDLAQRAVSIDPLNPLAQYLLGILYNFQERWSLAAERMGRAIELGGTNIATRGDLGYVYHRLGRDQDAFDVVMAGDVPPEMVKPAREGFAADGYLGMIRATLAIVTQGGTTCGPFPWMVAGGSSVVGDREQMYRCLAAAIEQRQVLMISGYPGMHPYREEPRFKELLARMNLPYTPGELGAEPGAELRTEKGEPE